MEIVEYVYTSPLTGLEWNVIKRGSRYAIRDPDNAILRGRYDSITAALVGIMAKEDIDV